MFRSARILSGIGMVLLLALGSSARGQSRLPHPWWAEDNAPSAMQQESPALTPDDRAYLEKKPPEAFLRSMVLPGWGQRFAERPGRAALFTTVEAGIWTGLILSQQSWKSGEKRYIAFAREHAGISSGNHDYYVNIGNYNNRDDYNTAKRQQRAYDEQYRGGSTWWEWDSSANRATFKDIRIGADRDHNRIYYLIGGLLLNRVVSAIDAGRGLASHQSKLRKQGGITLGIDPGTGGPSLVWRGNLGH